MLRSFSIFTGVVALSFQVMAQAPASSASVFTAEQATNGASVYAQNCAACHGINMEGSGDAPALVGASFMLKWRTKMVSELFGEILQTMPASNPGSLSEAAALNSTAYILQRNPELFLIGLDGHVIHHPCNKLIKCIVAFILEIIIHPPAP